MHLHTNKEHKKIPFPLIGQRIIRTAVAVLVCLLIHIGRGYEGNVVESCVAAIICLQPYVKDSWENALNRLCGTFLGGIWGLLFLLLMQYVPELGQNMVVVYCIMAIGVVLSLYSCVLLKTADSASLASIVFLCVIIAYPDVDTPLVQSMNRIIDTIIGVVVAITINSFHLPRVKQPQKVFFLHLNHLAADRYTRISSRVLIELNHLYDSGARICLETQYAPAFLISQLQTMHLTMPVIVMGGAAVYDIRENVYSDVQAISHEHVDYLYDYLNSHGLCACIFALRGNSMLIFHSMELSQLEEEDYMLMRRSPYRNYIDGKYQEDDQILGFRVMVGPTKAQELEARLNGNLTIAENFHVLKIMRPKHDGQFLFYFYHKDVSIENAERRMVERLRMEEEDIEPVRIQPKSLLYDPARDATILLHRIRRNYLIPVWSRKNKMKNKKK